MAMISSTIHLGQMKATITRALRNYLLAKNPFVKPPPKQNLQIGRYILF